MDNLPRFQIHLTPTGTRVEVDGTDISNAVLGLQVTRSTRSELPVVGIEVSAELVDIDVQGVGATPVSPAEWLEAVDVDALERRALEEDGKPIQAALRILKEEARGPQA